MPNTQDHRVDHGFEISFFEDLLMDSFPYVEPRAQECPEFIAAQAARRLMSIVLLDACADNLEGLDRDLLLRQIGLTLISVAQALDGALPAAEFLDGGHHLMVVRIGDNVMCWWAGVSPPSERSATPPVDVVQLVLACLARHADGLPRVAGTRVAERLAEMLLSGGYVPDGFVLGAPLMGMTNLTRTWIDMAFDDSP